jgi:DNA mismatch repair protein MutH
MITKLKALENLNKYIGRDLHLLSQNFGITTFKNGKQNKGWKGLVLERLCGLQNDNKKAPNGLGFELKSVSFIRDKKDNWVPKETMAITMINQKDLLEHDFFKSHCWEKLKSLIICACSWRGKNSERSELISVSSLDFVNSKTLINEIENDYEFIRKKLREQGFSKLTGKDGKWIQARTKGPGHGSTSRAFYARKALILELIKFPKI